jgi:hypothetical protein
MSQTPEGAANEEKLADVLRLGRSFNKSEGSPDSGPIANTVDPNAMMVSISSPHMMTNSELPTAVGPVIASSGPRDIPGQKVSKPTNNGWT